MDLVISPGLDRYDLYYDWSKLDDDDNTTNRYSQHHIENGILLMNEYEGGAHYNHHIIARLKGYITVPKTGSYWIGSSDCGYAVAQFKQDHEPYTKVYNTPKRNSLNNMII